MNSYIHRFEPLWGVWKVEQLLGEGSYGRVWQVRRDDMEGACLAAVKEIVIPSSKGNLTGARAEGMGGDFRMARDHRRAAVFRHKAIGHYYGRRVPDGHCRRRRPGRP